MSNSIHSNRIDHRMLTISHLYYCLRVVSPRTRSCVHTHPHTNTHTHTHTHTPTHPSVTKATAGEEKCQRLNPIKPRKKYLEHFQTRFSHRASVLSCLA